MFLDEPDFISGINRIGICKIIAGVMVFAYSLMDNHVHFLLYGTYAQCLKFINKYKFLTGIRIAQRHHQNKHIKNLPVSIIPLKTEEDILEVVAYIDRNAMMSGFKGLPHEYQWSSSRLLFKEDCRVTAGEFKVGDFSRNQLRDLLKTRVTLPDEWTFDERGMLNPACFTEWKKVEDLFRSAVRYLYFVTKKLEGKIDMTLNQGHDSFISDKDLRIITSDLCLKEFGEPDIRKLSVSSRLKLARTLRKEYSSTRKQIGRMLHLDAKILEGFI